MQRCLEGLKIADFSWTVAAPLSTKCLADYGASVVKIESIRRPDILRSRSPYAGNRPGINRSGTFNLYNSNKYSMSLDLQRPEGIELAKRIVKWADVVIENFAPGVMERLGLGYSELKKLSPQIIMLRSSAQGQTGPHASLPGFGVMLQGLAGFNSVLSWPDRDPLINYSPYTDYIAPFFMVIATLAALEYRDQIGKGQYIDLSQVEAGINFLSPQLLDYVVNTRLPKRMGNRCSYASPHGVFRCKGEDRWCAIAIFNDQQWDAFKKVCKEQWCLDPKFATALLRIHNEDQLEQLVQQWTQGFPAEELMTNLQNAGVPAGVASDGSDLFEDPQLNKRNHFWYIEHPDMGMIVNEDFSFKLSKTPSRKERSSPCLGQDTEYICREILGLSDEDFIKLLNMGIFT